MRVTPEDVFSLLTWLREHVSRPRSCYHARPHLDEGSRRVTEHTKGSGAARSSIEPLEPRRLLAAQMVGDLNLAPASSSPEQSLQVGGMTYFVANDGLHGGEVWR